MIYIDDLKTGDSGIYDCSLVNRDDPSDLRTSVYELHVSKTKGQLKIIDTALDEEYSEGDVIKLFHIAESFPVNDYNVQWRKVSSLKLYYILYFLFFNYFFCLEIFVSIKSLSQLTII